MLTDGDDAAPAETCFTLGGRPYLEIDDSALVDYMREEHPPDACAYPTLATRKWPARNAFHGEFAWCCQLCDCLPLGDVLF